MPRESNLTQSALSLSTPKSPEASTTLADRAMNSSPVSAPESVQTVATRGIPETFAAESLPAGQSIGGPSLWRPPGPHEMRLLRDRNQVAYDAAAAAPRPGENKKFLPGTEPRGGFCSLASTLGVQQGYGQDPEAETSYWPPWLVR